MASWDDQTGRFTTRGPIYDKSSIKSGTTMSLSDLPAHVQSHSDSCANIRVCIFTCQEISIRLKASILHDLGRLIPPNPYDKNRLFLFIILYLTVYFTV